MAVAGRLVLPVPVRSSGEGQVPPCVIMCRVKHLTHATVHESLMEAMLTVPETCQPWG